jgi:hypothetical protein
MVQSYRDLVAWNKAMELVTEIYRLIHDFPKEELFGLTSQIRRAAVSIPSNIAEGKGRLSKGEIPAIPGQRQGFFGRVGNPDSNRAKSPLLAGSRGT